MKKHAQSLGELCIKTEVIGDATVLAEILQRMPKTSPEKMLSFLSFSSMSDGIQQSEMMSEGTSSALSLGNGTEYDDEVTEVLDCSKEFRTSTVVGRTAKWRKEKFAMSLSYPGIFTEASFNDQEQCTLHLRVFSGRKLLRSYLHPSVSGRTGIDDMNNDIGQLEPTNAYFTVIPVLTTGKLKFAEQQQSLTVYGTRNPEWPKQEFVFGKDNDIGNISHLSLHLYSRELRDGKSKPVSLLLSDEERKQRVQLKRYELLKLLPSGDVDDKDQEVLQYDQRVLALRRCRDGGRFFPARVKRYFPSPVDTYDIWFENGIESIPDVWDLFSLDFKGKVKSIRSDGNVDILLDKTDGADKYARNVSTSLLIPVHSFTPQIECTMARRFDTQKEKSAHAARMKHTLTGFSIDILSASGLPSDILRPGCVITFVGASKLPSSRVSKTFGLNSNGELFGKNGIVNPGWTSGEPFTFKVSHGKLEVDVHNLHLFDVKPLKLGKFDASSKVDSIMEEGIDIVSHIESILIRVVDQADKKEPSVNDRTVGFVKLDLSTLHHGIQDVHKQVIPSDEPYHKFVGSLFLHITACDSSNQSKEEKAVAGSAPSRSLVHEICGIERWYQRRNNELNENRCSLSRLSRRKAIRSALTPTENAQLDAFHTVLVVVMKRIVSILKEIKLFEEFEVLSNEEMVKFRFKHTINANSKSEWLGRLINEMNVDIRKNIVLELEMELLDIAASKLERVYPKTTNRDEWIKLRAVRQSALLECGTFFMKSRTNKFGATAPHCFKGEGMISWILRSPSILWDDRDDGWKKYCHDEKLKASCALRWSDGHLDLDPDAIQPPRSREQALLWLNALSDAGFIENITSNPCKTDANKKYFEFEDRSDQYYVLREVHHWQNKLKQNNSLFPLDLVKEMDLYSIPDSVNGSMTDGAHGFKMFSKKLTEHVEGLLGMENGLSSVLLSPDIKKNMLLNPIAQKTKDIIDEQVLWDWKYCIFIPSHKCLYVYKTETSGCPVLIIDMSSGGCNSGLNFTHDSKGGWFDIKNPKILVLQVDSQKFVPLNEHLKHTVTKTKADKSTVIEFKTSDAQSWVQAFGRAGIRIDLRLGQDVIFKRLNPTVLQQKCIEYVTEFDPNDLEGSFQRLLNRFYSHDSSALNPESEEATRALRSQIRNELKKAGKVGDTVLAYFGKGMRHNPKPTDSRSFTVGALYTARIVNIRTPYKDPSYRFKTVYDQANQENVPKDLQELLRTYKVTDKASWLHLSKNARDLFLLFDVEYRHEHEIIVEEGLMRDHIRMNDGDLDAAKVSEQCTDLNLLFKPSDLEDCVKRMVMQRSGQRSLGYLKIPIKTVSTHRAMDVWYPLAAEHDMVQKMELGQVRVHLRLVQENLVTRSKKMPALLQDIKEVIDKQSGSGGNPIQFIRDFVTAKTKRTAALPSDASGFLASHERSFLKVTIVEARKLKAADVITSDPYVKLVLIRESNGKEENTKLKTDIKPSTLSPKWKNQEFFLGNTEITSLTDKKALLLRVMDHDLTSLDDPLGYVMLEFYRDRLGCITGLILKHADANGDVVTKNLDLDDRNSVTVNEMLLADEKLGQLKFSKARANNAEHDGRLGKLQFKIEIIQNENYVDPDAASPSKLSSTVQTVETKFSLEIAFKDLTLTGKSADKPETKEMMKNNQFKCKFEPRGKNGQRIHYDPQYETLTAGSAVSINGAQSSSAFHLLGKTFDMTRVEYFDVQITCDSVDRTFRGKLGESGIFEKPSLCTMLRNEVITLKDKDLELQLTLDINLIGINRADRLKRVLTETFRLVDLPFDAKIMNKSSGSERENNLQLFLWEVCKSNIFPGSSVSRELLLHVGQLCKTAKLHWKYTPQLLCFVMEYVFSNGEKDRLSYHDAAALDFLMDRWSQVLMHVSESKSQLIGNLHGKQTPQLMLNLLTECDWTGFDSASLSDGSNSDNMNREIIFVEGRRVHAQLSPLKFAGMAVDVLLCNGLFVAGTIIRENGDDSFDVAFCTTSKLRDEGDQYFSDEEELHPLLLDQIVFVCPLVQTEPCDSKGSTATLCNSSKPGRTGQVMKVDKVGHPAQPYLVAYLDGLEPKEEWRSRFCLDSMLSGIVGKDVYLQLNRDDFVRVSATTRSSPESAIDTSSTTETRKGDDSARPGKIVKNHGNARYEIKYLDGKSPKKEPRVARDRLEPVAEDQVYDGEVKKAYVTLLKDVTGVSQEMVVNYDVMLANGTLVEGVAKEQLRVHHQWFPSDKSLLASVYLTKLNVCDSGANASMQHEQSIMGTKLNDLWGNDQILKVYVMLPNEVARIQLRNSVTKQLSQAALMERNERSPRFLGPIHGFVKGSKMNPAEMKKVELLYASTMFSLNRQHDKGKMQSDSCFSLILAPQPRVEIHGTLRVSPTELSSGLFKSLLTLATTRPNSLKLLFQRVLRSTIGTNVPLNRKERIAHISHIDICFHRTPVQSVVVNQLTSKCDGETKTERGTKPMVNVDLAYISINLRFQLAIPHNNKGSMADAVCVSYQDASQILATFKSCNALYLADYSDASSLEDKLWSMETMKDLASDSSLSKKCTLELEILNRDGEKGREPAVSVELVPLDDISLSVKDVNGITHEVCLPIDKILAEAKLRRELSKNFHAQVLSGPHFVDESHPQQQQVHARHRRDSMLLTSTAAPLLRKLKKEHSVAPYYRIKYLEGAKSEVNIFQTELKFNTLNVNVVQVSRLALKERMGEDISVDIMLISSDFEPQAGADHAFLTPFGMLLTPKGEMCKDLLGNSYPESSSLVLTKQKNSSDWFAANKTPTKVSFGYPAVDLARISDVLVRVIDKKTKETIGQTKIPLSAINQTKAPSQDDPDWATGSVVAKEIPKQTFSICRRENNHEKVVGKITLQLERSKCFGKGDEVLAKRFEEDHDLWHISSYELLAHTLEHHRDQLTSGLLSAGPGVTGGGRELLKDNLEQEVQLKKILKVKMIANAMDIIYGTNSSAAGNSDCTLELSARDRDQIKNAGLLVQLKRTLVDSVEDAAIEFGLRRPGKRLPWSSSKIREDRKPKTGEVVIANVNTSTDRLRRIILRLYQKYRYELIPTLQELHEVDAQGEHVNIVTGEQLLSFFEEEVEDLEQHDQIVFRRVYQRIRLMKVVQVLEDVMHTTLRVKVMDQDPGMGDDLIGMTTIPFIDLLDQELHDNIYELTKPKKSSGFGSPITRLGELGATYGASMKSAYGTSMKGSGNTPSSVVVNTAGKFGKVHLRIQLSFSESSLLEQATQVYKSLKLKYIVQHEKSRQRINAAVVPVQIRRWKTIKSYLEELQQQSKNKLHWERTPLILSLVWDIFMANKKALSPLSAKQQKLTEEEIFLEDLAEKAEEFRVAALQVHTRWVNLQPLLEELLAMQGATQLHAQRTPQLLQSIESEVEGLDIVLRTAWQQVMKRWKELENALEELTAMKERNKLHLGRAPQLLSLVSQRCSKGLCSRHAEGVSNVQFRWMAITQRDGPLCELRLMEKKGLHWRRTHELVLLLNEQCEGFSDIDAKALNMVERRWEQVQEWLDDVVEMQNQHMIDCEMTPFILKRMHLLDQKHKLNKYNRPVPKLLQGQTSSSPVKKRDGAFAKAASLMGMGSSTNLGQAGQTSPTKAPVERSSTAVEEDVGRLEGLLEWYAIEEAKHELERIPCHRITTDADRNNWLPFSRDGKDSRLFVSQEEITFSAINVRLALEDRGVIPKASAYHAFDEWAPGALKPRSVAISGLPKDLQEEIREMEAAIENKNDEDSYLYALSNRERVAELYLVIESLGKSDLLWKIDNVVNTNKELEVPTRFLELLDEMKMRQIPTTELEDLARSLTVILQKEELMAHGIEVPANANFTVVLSLMHKHQVKDVSLPAETTGIQNLLQERGMDRKGEPVYMRGARIGTQCGTAFDGTTTLQGKTGADSTANSAALNGAINAGLGIIDTQIEALRRSLLFEALRKRCSLIKSFPGETRIFSEEDILESTEVDTFGDYMTLIERFQQLLIHESYTKRLAEYAALERCMRALVNAHRDQIVTKEDIAIALRDLNGNYRLPLEAFTSEELIQAAQKGKIRTPSQRMLARCPRGKNAKAMAYYAAVSYAAMVYQDTSSFRSRLDLATQRFKDTLSFEDASSLHGEVVPKNRGRLSLKEMVVEWLHGAESSVLNVSRTMTPYHRQRLIWASAAFTLRNRWFQRGFGWCDSDSLKNAAGVKILLQRLLIFETANKMHMIHTETLLREINEKCVNLRIREKAAKAKLEERFAKNHEMLEELIKHAEKCINNRKLHTEKTPALLHAIEQACVVPDGLNARHREAYHVVTSHWIPHRQHLDELVRMHKEGTFSIHRTPELLSAMKFHTEGVAGADEIDIDRVLATTSESENQQEFVDMKIDELRFGQRKNSTTFNLELDLHESATPAVASEGEWQSLSPSKRIVQPLSPREKQTGWKVDTKVAAGSVTKQTVVLESKKSDSPRRKSSLGDEIKEILRSPSKWLIATPEPVARIRPEVFFPTDVSHDTNYNPGIHSE